ncbi:MAG TPA: arylsulfotransferase family protein [Gemmatimonadales bacterium]|nr:arylsulfotransferase family protein [Gemmatimonadales bacterium]
MRILSAAAVAALAACATEPAADRPVLQTVSVTNPAGNVLSALVAVRVEGAESVAVRYAAAGSPLGNVTPAVVLHEGEAILPVFGLLPGTAYELRVTAYGPGGRVEGEPLPLTTGPLPDDLPAFRAGGPSPSPGYVLFASGVYGLIIDNTGRVVWYVRFANGPSLNFQAQPNGRYVARPATPEQTGKLPVLEYDLLGDVSRSLGCARDLRPRFHDLIVERDGGYWIMCDEARTMDLTTVGGMPEAQVVGTVIQHLDATGALLFEWSPFDHFEVTDLEEASRTGASVNWTHGNAIELDRDGNLLVSFRSLSEITKIDTRTGAVIWRMGGLRNQFGFEGPALPFRSQHGLRISAAGELVLLDNLGEAESSRAERYRVDDSGFALRLAAAYAPAAATRATLGGTTQLLPDGHTLVAYGDGAAVIEYDTSGAIAWRIEGDPGYVFRAQRIQSLYHPEIGLAR